MIDEIEGRVVGCYKVRADTEDGYDVQQELFYIKHEWWHEEEDGASLDLLQRREHKKLDDEGNKDARFRLGNDMYDGKPLSLPNDIRQLNGLLLDPRPIRIALRSKDREAFRLPGSIKGIGFERHGARYKQLEYTIRNAMRNNSDMEQELPVYRLKQIRAVEEAGYPEVQFTEEQLSESEDENDIGVKLGAEDEGSCKKGLEEHGCGVSLS